MMTERQRKFREQYKAAISPYYSGLLHIIVIYGVGLGAIWWSLGRLSNASWEWLVVIYGWWRALAGRCRQ